MLSDLLGAQWEESQNPVTRENRWQFSRRERVLFILFPKLPRWQLDSVASSSAVDTSTVQPNIRMQVSMSKKMLLPLALTPTDHTYGEPDRVSRYA